MKTDGRSSQGFIWQVSRRIGQFLGTERESEASDDASRRFKRKRNSNHSNATLMEKLLQVPLDSSAVFSSRSLIRMIRGQYSRCEIRSQNQRMTVPFPNPHLQNVKTKSTVFFLVRFKSLRCSYTDFAVVVVVVVCSYSSISAVSSIALDQFLYAQSGHDTLNKWIFHPLSQLLRSSDLS